MTDLSIIILSYNTKELLRECLLSIRNQELGLAPRLGPRGIRNYEVIVVDNASSDGSVETIQQFNNSTIDKANKATIIANKENAGYTKGNNQGVKIAEGRYLLFLNADTVVYKGTLEYMITFMDEHKDVGAATCAVVLSNGNLDDSCHRGFPTPWRSFCHFFGLARMFPKARIFAGYSLGFLNLSTTHEIDSCSGAFMIVRREAGEQVGWWDEDFFWYGDDLDFCFRLKEKDFRVYFVPDVKILHYKGVSGGIKDISKHLTVATRETRLRVTNARFEAMKLFYKKHYYKKYPSLVTWIVILGINLKWWLTLKTLS